MSEKQFNSKLKGNEVLVTNCDGMVERGWDKKCFVADIDFKKGITIKHLESGEDIYCLNTGCPDYERKFKYVVAEIKKGVMNNGSYLDKFYKTRFSDSQHSCAFK